MSNYYYSFVDKKIVLTEKEHKTVLDEMKKNKTVVILRGGDLILNMALVGTVSTTSMPLPFTTAEQELQALQGETVKALAPPRSRVYQPHTSGLQDIKNPEDKVCENCQHIHFIPGDSRVCVACSKNYKKGVMKLAS